MAVDASEQCIEWQYGTALVQLHRAAAFCDRAGERPVIIGDSATSTGSSACGDGALSSRRSPRSVHSLCGAIQCTNAVLKATACERWWDRLMTRGLASSASSAGRAAADNAGRAAADNAGRAAADNASVSDAEVVPRTFARLWPTPVPGLLGSDVYSPDAS